MPACDQKDDLSKYVCFNCKKSGFMSFFADRHYPFYCTNCDLGWDTLSCPNCRSQITKKFIDEGEVPQYIIITFIFIIIFPLFYVLIT
jgi:hypothetical protein